MSAGSVTHAVSGKSPIPTPVTCGHCGQPVADLYRWQSQYMRINEGFKLLLLCQTCATAHYKSSYGWRSSRCVGCGRTVHYSHTRWGRRYCTQRCRQAETARFRIRSSRRVRPCEHCGDPFTPPRSDGRYCSPACRQRAYRRRLGVTG